MKETYYSKELKTIRIEALTLLNIYTKLIGILTILFGILFFTPKYVLYIVFCLFIFFHILTYLIVSFSLAMIPLMLKWNDEICEITTFNETKILNRNKYAKVTTGYNELQRISITDEPLLDEDNKGSDFSYATEEVEITRVITNVIFNQKIDSDDVGEV